jgi:DNA-directed RNA polymerase specialized sigma24 family protein
MDTQKHLPPLDPTWLTPLRRRFAEITARRVPTDAVEDLVQDALGIVLAKGPAEAHRAGDTEPSLRWCFNVLRNVIGNWYQKRRHHEPVENHDLADERPDVLAALAADEQAQTIRTAVAELRLQRPDCADWLWSMAQGTKAGALAERARMEHSAFYRKVYRCRRMLAEILQRKGVSP